MQRAVSAPNAVADPALQVAAATQPDGIEVATERLGSINVQVAGDTNLAVQLTVERASTATLLTAQGDRLEAAVAAQGVRLDALSVDVRGGDGERRTPAPPREPQPMRLPAPSPATRSHDRYA